MLQEVCPFITIILKKNSVSMNFFFLLIVKIGFISTLDYYINQIIIYSMSIVATLALSLSICIPCEMINPIEYKMYSTKVFLKFPFVVLADID